MPVETHLSRIVHDRRLRRSRRGRSARPLGWIFLLAAGLLCAAGAWILIAPLPGSTTDLHMGERPQGAQFFDRTGKLLVEAGSARARESRWYPAETAPDTDCVLPAFLAARNLTLEEIQTADPLSVPRAFINVLADVPDPAGEAAAELLAMNGSESGAWENARLAGALAARYEKIALVEWILNVRLYGHGTVGVDDAALTYFGTHAGALTDAECAALEASASDPALANDPAGWKSARNSILGRMLNGGFLENTDWGRAIAAPLLPGESEPAPAGGDSVFGGKIPILDSFLELAVDQLGIRHPEQQLPRAGIRVTTTLDLDFELQLLCAAQNLLAPPEDSSTSLPTLEGKPCDLAALLGPAGSGNLPADLALAVIHPEDGEVLAYFDSARGEAPVVRGPAGTALLPFLYLSAFARGYSPASMLLDIPRADIPPDPDREYRGPLSARTALQQRALAAAAGMAASVGMDHIDRTLTLLGLRADALAGPELEARLRESVGLLKITQAYATLANGGLEVAGPDGGAVVLLRVEERDGKPNEEFTDRQSRRVFGSDLAYLLQEILSDRSGQAELSAPALTGSRSTVAAVLGEDPADQGAWAFALTPGFAVGTRGRAYAPADADPRQPWILAQAAAGWALRELPVQTWTEPPGIVHRDVCVPSGLLPGRYCPSVVSEIFLAGNEPAQVDSSYQPVAVNRETGRLATIWTPINLVDERVFFLLEGDARIWAEHSGFPVPPDTYDSLPDSFPYFDNLHLSSPSPLSVVKGKVVLRGTAAETGMERYLLQAGPGLYPSVWYTLGSGEKAVREGVLGEWDTSAADGVWSIQLTAVFSGGKILTVAIPLTIDNTPPAIRWIQPAAPQRISVDGGGAVILHVDVTDNLAIESVEFYLDGKVRTRLESGPFSVRWTGLPAGRHTAKICARDRIGNETCTNELEVDIGLKTSGEILYNTPGKVEL
jgi:hypothetical protein